MLRIKLAAPAARDLQAFAGLPTTSIRPVYVVLPPFFTFEVERISSVDAGKLTLIQCVGKQEEAVAKAQVAPFAADFSPTWWDKTAPQSNARSKVNAKAKPLADSSSSAAGSSSTDTSTSASIPNADGRGSSVSTSSRSKISPTAAAVGGDGVADAPGTGGNCVTPCIHPRY